MSISNFEKIWNISIRITDTDKSRSDGNKIRQKNETAGGNRACLEDFVSEQTLAIWKQVESLEKKDDVKIRGVRIEEEDDEELGDPYDQGGDRDRKRGRKRMGRPVRDVYSCRGSRRTCRHRTARVYRREISQKLAEHLKSLMGEGEKSVLIVGLGNRDVTPGCTIGPYVWLATSASPGI